MAITYEPIATTTLSSSGTITFSSIPATYTDLVLITRLIGSTAYDFDIRLNGDTGSNYSYTALYGTGSTTGGTTSANLTFMRLDYYGYIETTVGQVNITNIQNYASTSVFKTAIAQNGNANNGMGINIGLWRNTAAVNSISILGTMSTGSAATLYGIKAA